MDDCKVQWLVDKVMSDSFENGDLVKIINWN
jgi:hypothetical protein